MQSTSARLPRRLRGKGVGLPDGTSLTNRSAERVMTIQTAQSGSARNRAYSQLAGYRPGLAWALAIAMLGLLIAAIVAPPRRAYAEAEIQIAAAGGPTGGELEAAAAESR
jgi:uncharacterized protein (DUF58 family)